jgi:RNA polymerase sigma-70 factor (ECF subfamily)
LRWQLYDRAVVQNPTAFLVTTTTRLAMNAAQSARTRHEMAVGRGLPELVDETDAPVSRLERSEALAAGIRVLLQRLSPTERAAYVLRQAFDYPYAQIAEMLQLTEANARQLVSRSGKRIAAAVKPPTEGRNADVHAEANDRPRPRGVCRIRQLEPSHRAVASSRH